MCAALVGTGCNVNQHTPNVEEPMANAKVAPAAAPRTPGSANSDPVQIHGMGAGAAAPVTGGQDLMGSGGGAAGQLAKDRAKRAAGSGGNSSLSQMPPDDTGGN